MAQTRAATVSEMCVLCGGRGSTYLGPLTDREFGVPGSYYLQRCASCRLVWLQDMPEEDRVGDFYANYYTHTAPPTSGSVASSRRALVARVWPLTAAQRQRRREMYEFFLPDDGGSVLEVGCGAGGNLAKLRDRGWDVVGQDIDPLSAESARAGFGIRVEVGSIADVDLPEGTFDALLLNHVVEHLREPHRDLERCWRLLKPGGRMVIITPNITSVGAGVFRSRWRGLEPPRHLFLYDVRTLRKMLHDSGFHSAEVFTRAARTEMIAFDTMNTQLREWKPAPRYVAAKLVGMSLQVLADLTGADRRDRGDELVAVARRQR